MMDFVHDQLDDRVQNSRAGAVATRSVRAVTGSRLGYAGEHVVQMLERLGFQAGSRRRSVSIGSELVSQNRDLWVDSRGAAAPLRVAATRAAR